MCISLYFHAVTAEMIEAAFSFCFTFLMITCCFNAFAEPHQRPNIVIILADDLVSYVSYCLIGVLL